MIVSLSPEPNVAKLIREYLDGFHGHYRVPRHCPEEDDLKEWLAQTGAQYRYWIYYKGHVEDSHCVVNIKDPHWCTLFELRWTHLILGTVDRPKP
jgi:hypothetical protein